MKIDHSAVSSWINMTEKRKICDSVIIRKLKVLPGLYNQKQPPEVFCKKKSVLRSFAKFTGKHLHQSLFFNKIIKKETAFFDDTKLP